ncbi:hypothetical protein Q7C36_023502 [Tachysurus vachellii]|uniref:Uncharacterized protein n=1 Tax=Tachysurus vachellii TaxID=175792 RepID=A0AA88ITB5_TACVA|nr:hypothetical protein Q7C36_023502 [Tachysurus vachellii]
MLSSAHGQILTVNIPLILKASLKREEEKRAPFWFDSMRETKKEGNKLLKLLFGLGRESFSHSGLKREKYHWMVKLDPYTF